MKSEIPEMPCLKHFRVFFVETVGLEAIGRKGKSFVYGTFPD
jgi:hypothetical protein